MRMRREEQQPQAFRHAALALTGEAGNGKNDSMMQAATRTTLLVVGWCAIVVASTGFGMWQALSPESRAAISEDQRAALLVALAVVGLIALAAGVRAFLQARLGLVPRLVQAMEVLRTANPSLRLTSEAPPELRRAVNALAEHHQNRIRDVESQIEEATDALAGERDMLAALLSQLQDAVLLCSADGRILLYNPHARQLLGDEQAGFVGLGRSVFSLFRRSVILHCLDRLQNHDAEPLHAVISTRDGRRMHARFSRLQSGQLHGFLLTLTAPVETTGDAGGRSDSFGMDPIDRLLRDAVRQLTPLRAAIETIQQNPELGTAENATYHDVIATSCHTLAQTLESLQQRHRQHRLRQWPLEDIASDALAEILHRRVASAVESTVSCTVDPDAGWLSADSYRLAAAMRFIAREAHQHLQAQQFRIDIARADDGLIAIDLRWQGDAFSLDQWQALRDRPVQQGEGAMTDTMTDIAWRQNGEIRPHHEAGDSGIRWLLPETEAPTQPAMSGPAPEARPEFYDFNLFQHSTDSNALAARPLRELICTAFDTETTGLNPTDGDEIIAIGAIRVVNGRILSQEVFETLVATRRGIAPSARAVHGISADMLRDAPEIGPVLSRFRDFSEDTTLLAHNAAFDLSFLERQGAPAGVHFDQSALDTLLLSAVAFPDAEDHQLERIAERLGVPIVGRHTALGDAIVAAEVFVRLIPLLEMRGVDTLEDALRASKETWYARLQY